MRCRTCILLAVILLLTASSRGDEAESRDLKLLQGTWICVSSTKDGKKVKTYLNVRATIQGNSLTWHFPQPDGTTRQTKNQFRIDPNQRPKHFDWWVVGKKDRIDRRLYKVTKDELHWSTNLDYQTRPESFETGRWHFIAKRVRNGTDDR